MRSLAHSCAMKFEWEVRKEEETMLKYYLGQKGISKRLLAKIKFQGGELRVNGKNVNVLVFLKAGDRVEVRLPDEKSNPYLTPSEVPLDILFEDEHFLVVNKPAGVAAVPSATHKEETMANRVKGYAKRKGKMETMVHVVTRLDRDTSGAMIFAKHTFAHAQLDQQLRKKTMEKRYLAVVEGKMDGDLHGIINAPIARTEDSIITRRVHPTGKSAFTEYFVKSHTQTHTIVEVLLHTGRTHQIRVHFSHIGHPLLGDELYGGMCQEKMTRQALHCSFVSFDHPFNEKEISVHAPLPNDLKNWLKQLDEKERIEALK